MPDLTLAASDPTPWIAVVVAALITASATIAAAFISRRRSGDISGAEAVAAKPTLQPSPQLPPRPHFVNRQDEMQRAVSRFHAGRGALAIEGGVGVGKSTMAGELFHCLHGNAARFGLLEHAFLWIDARHRCLSLREICGFLSLSTDNQSLSTIAEDEKLGALRLHLANRKTVLLLDNLDLADD